MNIQLRLFSTGYCTHPEWLVVKGGRLRVRKFPAMVALLTHPTHGHMLFDTGYAPRFFEETRAFPNKLYGLITPVMHSEREQIHVQLSNIGIQPGDISLIFLSHFHADHTAGLIDFPTSRVVASRAAYQEVAGKTGIPALRKAFLPGLMPADLYARLSFLEELTKVPFRYGLGGGFLHAYDLLGDGSVLAIELTGHAIGQYGLFFETENGPVFLIADACWLSSAFTHLQLPPAPAYMIMDDPQAYNDNVKRLHRLHQHHPAIHIIPTHCEETFAYYHSIFHP